MSYAGINGTVIQKNNEQFFCDPCGNYGKTMNLPCGSTAAEVAPAIYWAVPVKADYVQGFEYEIADTAPTFDSIQTFKLTNLQNGDWFMVVGTAEDYFAACAACCDASPTPTIVTATRLNIAPEQYLCADSDGAFITYFGIQPLADGARYVSVVSSGNTQQTPIQEYATGSTSLANLVTYLNTNYSALGTWSQVGSPAAIKLVGVAEGWVGFIACQETS